MFHTWYQFSFWLALCLNNFISFICKETERILFLQHLLHFPIEEHSHVEASLIDSLGVAAFHPSWISTVCWNIDTIILGAELSNCKRSNFCHLYFDCISLLQTFSATELTCLYRIIIEWANELTWMILSTSQTIKEEKKRRKFQDQNCFL